jgi:hypothetical protein
MPNSAPNSPRKSGWVAAPGANLQEAQKAKTNKLKHRTVKPATPTTRPLDVAVFSAKSPVNLCGRIGGQDFPCRFPAKPLGRETIFPAVSLPDGPG